MPQQTLPQPNKQKRSVPAGALRLQLFLSEDAYRRITVAAAKRLTGKTEIVEELVLKHLAPADSQAG